MNTICNYYRIKKPNVFELMLYSKSKEGDDGKNLGSIMKVIVSLLLNKKFTNVLHRFLPTST